MKQLSEEFKMPCKVTFYYVFITVTLALHFTSISEAQVNPINHTVTVGDLKIRMLQDAQICLPISYLSGIDNDEVVKLLGGSDPVWIPVNAFLVQTPNHFVLVDAGLGKYPGENSGHLLEQMEDAGIDPADIDLILITHFHFDHIGGLVSPEGKRVFPNAIIRVPQSESDLWMCDSSMIPTNLRKRASQIKAIFASYDSAKAYLPFLPDEDLGDGIRAYPANGHTPGHTVYTFSSDDKEFWCIGDLVHFGATQFKYPSASIISDSDAEMAIASRIDFFERAAMNHAILAGAHLPEMVQLERTGDAFVAIPVNTP